MAAAPASTATLSPTRPSRPPSGFRIWLAAARVRTLPASVAPVLVGTALAGHGHQFHPLRFVAALLGAIFVQVRHLDWEAFALAVPVGLLAAGILIVNNVRDIDTDRRAGKRTLAVRLGR